jgi:hypothetical protein
MLVLQGAQGFNCPQQMVGMWGRQWVVLWSQSRGPGFARLAGKLPAKEVALWRAVGFKIASRTRRRPPIEEASKTVQPSLIYDCQWFLVFIY